MDPSAPHQPSMMTQLHHHQNPFSVVPNSLSGPPSIYASSRPIESLNTPPPYEGSSKKKRGRPRKYAPDGNIALALSPVPIPTTNSEGIPTPISHSHSKKQRGRPPGSGKKQLDALGSSGVCFTPHVIMVKSGEDIASKIMAFSQQGPRTVCILSANGAVNNVTLCQSPVSNNTVSYEGRFEIISLSASVISESNNRTHVLCVSLAGSDGRVLGGIVPGMLTAATPVQIVVGSFIPDKKKSESGVTKSGGALAGAPAAQLLNFSAHVAATTGSPNSHGELSESSEENSHSPTPNNNGPGNFTQPIHGLPIYSSMSWPTNTN